MNERIGTAETARILNCSLTHARKLMRKAKADTRRESRADGGIRITFLKSDVDAYASKHLSVKRERHHGKADNARKIVAWADGLRRWPTDAAIEKHTSDVYRFKDVDGVIDTRIFRKANGKYLRALREPAMVREGTNGMRLP